MVTCSKCGLELQSNDIYCINCGAPAKILENESKIPKTNYKITLIKK